MNVSFTNKFDDVLESTNFKIFYGITFCLAEIISLLTNFGIIYFEYYGGDPMKRSLRNKLFSQLCKVLIFEYMIHNPGFAWRILIGPVNEKLAISMMFCEKCAGVMKFLYFTETVLHKVSMLFGFKHFCLTDEDFVFMFLNLFNISFAFAIQFSRWMLDSSIGEYYHFEILSGTFTNSIINFKMLFWPLFGLINIVIIIVGCLAILIKKYLMHKANQNRVQEIHIQIQYDENRVYNNQAYNMSILSSFEYFLLCIFVLIMVSRLTITRIILQLYGFDEDYQRHFNYLIFHVNGLWMYGIIAPILIMIKKKEVREFLWTEFNNCLLDHQ